MIRQTTLRIPPERITDLEFIKASAARSLKMGEDAINAVQILRRSVDARGRMPMFQIQTAVYSGEPMAQLCRQVAYKPADPARRVIVVGSGPAGLFAALGLIERGITPIVLERGKDVKQRRYDLKAINARGVVDPDSNYCFGEGGAGTYSDGKLYTRSTKRGDVKQILSILVQHGAVPDILVNAHPHIGSNRLPKIIEAIRNTIVQCHGEIHFNSRVTELLLGQNKIMGVATRDKEFTADGVILATGHSARDIYQLLRRHRILLEAKPYAMGVRVEHPQELINAIQYGTHPNTKFLPTASYSLACQVGQTGVYSFCMCPGGMLVPAATAPGELVLNGMSNSLRNLPHANAGVVVTIDSRQYDPRGESNPFAGLEFQRQIETRAFRAGGRSQAAPAQRMTDFLDDKISTTLPGTSYIPGMVSCSLPEILGPHIASALKQGFKIFGQRMKGYVTQEAKLLAVESRTSSPVRIPRQADTRMHPQVNGLFPAGEGAGYAGGIVSSAIDGQASAIAAAAYLNKI
jgi:uncharacterized FAD-dependent dehydrogenase